MAKKPRSEEWTPTRLERAVRAGTQAEKVERLKRIGLLNADGTRREVRWDGPSRTPTLEETNAAAPKGRKRVGPQRMTVIEQIVEAVQGLDERRQRLVLALVARLGDEPDVSLATRLAQEMTAPSEDPNAQPIIVAEPPRPEAPITRLFVIWDEWAALSQQDRSEIIMDAYLQAMGQEAALKITVAMGLTAAEAARMGMAS